MLKPAADRLFRASCPLCASADLETYFYDDHLKRQKLRRLRLNLARHLKPLISRLIHDFERRILFAPNRKIFRCRLCGYARADAWNLNSEVLKKYYHSDYWQADAFAYSEGSAFQIDDRALGQFQFIQRFLSGRRVNSSLEIGAASAAVSQKLKQSFPEARVNVVESGRGWPSWYRRLGFERISDFYPMPENNQKFDLIVGSHWLEHVVPDIGPVVEHLKSDLSQNGILFIEVPNCEDEYWRADIGDVPHIHFFTPTSLKRLFEEFGFVTLRIGTFGETVSEQLLKLKSVAMGSDAMALSDEARVSIRESVDRFGGTVIRALFSNGERH